MKGNLSITMCIVFTMLLVNVVTLYAQSSLYLPEYNVFVPLKIDNLLHKIPTLNSEIHQSTTIKNDVRVNAEGGIEKIVKFFYNNDSLREKSVNIIYVFVLGCVALIFIVLYLLKRKEHEHYIMKNLLLERKVEELSKCNKSKDRFFSIMAHDLRNPFNNLLQGLELLKGEYKNLSDKDRWSFICSLSHESIKIIQFLEHLLTWGRSQRGKVVVKWDNLRMRYLADEIIEFYRHAARKKKIIIVNRVPKKIVARGDRNVVETILRNLISNAIKFTAHGGQIVLIGGWENDNAVVGICDNGIGLSEDQREMLFELGQGHTTGTDGEEGSGLGLVVCRELLENIDGRIRTETTPGGGTTFIITLKKGEFSSSKFMKKQKV